ncbi:MAG: hypothetical protein QM728_11915 [Gordonia sp. (in: high G+C Gram-positive bacteria)]|uniref:hypothetical protein n=1 Tax=Gordonia sp. (in: high G+C Gram-positive bacteria) TaxID=84139 RepID=UPI0039E262C2
MQNTKSKRLGAAAAAALASGAIITAVQPAVADAAPDLRGRWSGVVVWPIQVNSAYLTVTRSRPLRGTIVLPGVCAAQWREIGRSGPQVRVFAHVRHSVRCRSNVWNLMITGTSITGPDSVNPSSWVRLTRTGPFGS